MKLNKIQIQSLNPCQGVCCFLMEPTLQGGTNEVPGGFELRALTCLFAATLTALHRPHVGE